MFLRFSLEANEGFLAVGGARSVLKTPTDMSLTCWDSDLKLSATTPQCEQTPLKGCRLDDCAAAESFGSGRIRWKGQIL